jgi:2-polyprenyl-6-methoxyphenol hydroxylase-like FAD-dependent oxidoreductase
MNKSDDDFLFSLNTVLKNSNHNLSNQKLYVKIPEIESIVNKRLTFPLSSLQAGNYTSQRIALVGDAAHSIHPMAGLGVNSGIIDSVLLANNIITNRKTGNDIG